MKFDDPSPDQQTLLLVIDDHDMLLLAQAVLSAGRRVLLAWDAQTALWNVRHMAIDSVLLREGLADSEVIERECITRGVPLLFMRGVVEDNIVRFTLPELAVTPAEILAEACCRVAVG